jgi:predicted acetyltransferase
VLERQRRGQDLGGFVERTWLIAEVAGAVVGRASIRHRLNDDLAFHGGHIGFAVRAAFRRRGYATGILRPSLVIAVVPGDEADDGVAFRRYWIT